MHKHKQLCVLEHVRQKDHLTDIIIIPKDHSITVHPTHIVM